MLLFSILMGVLNLVPDTVGGIDHDNETILSNIVWLEKDNPHNITGTVFVYVNKLNLNPSVIVKFNSKPGPGGITIDNDGRFDARGSLTKHITFTSNESTPLIGDWSGITFGSGSHSGDIIYSDISYASTGIYILGGNVTISDTTIINTTYGLVVNGGTAVINNLTIINSTNSGIIITGNNSSAEIANTNISESNIGLHILGGNSTINNVYLNNNTNSLLIKSPVDIENSTITNSSVSNFHITNSTTVKALNCSFDSNNNINPGSKLIRQWFVHVYVNDTMGNPIKDVNVTITPNSSAPSYYQTDNDGWKQWIVCTEYEETRTNITYRNPYNITVHKDGYNSTSIYPNITSSKTFHFTFNGYIKPISILDPIPKYWHNASKLKLNYTINDNSYIDNVSLYYRHSANNITFSNPVKTNSTNFSGQQSSLEGGFDFDFPAGNGYYQFYTIAYDKTGIPQNTGTIMTRIMGYDSIPPNVIAFGVPDINEDYTSVCRVNLTLNDTTSGIAAVPRINVKYDSTETTWALDGEPMVKTSRVGSNSASAEFNNRVADENYHFDIPAPSQGWEHFQNKSMLIEFVSSDRAGNFKLTPTIEKIDLVNHAPSIQIISPTTDSWYNDVVLIETNPEDLLDAGDPITENGIAMVVIQYSINSTSEGTNGTWENCSNDPINQTPFELSWDTKNILLNDNVWLKAQSVDNGGLNSQWQMVRVKIDNEPPTSTIKDYDDYWHNKDFLIVINADDGLGLGINKTFYQLNSASPQSTEFGSPLINTESASNTLEFWSVDMLGNEEQYKVLEGIKLDKTKPEISGLSISNITVSTSATHEVILTLNSSDSLSGLSSPPQYRVQYPGQNFSAWFDTTSINESSYSAVLNTSGVLLYQLGGEEITLEFRSIDNANNIETAELTELIDNVTSSEVVIEITHTSVVQWYTNIEIPINATVAANKAVGKVRLYFKTLLSEAFKSVSMIFVTQEVDNGGNGLLRFIYTINLPAQAEPGNVYYYFAAQDELKVVTLPEDEPDKNPFVIKIVEKKNDTIIEEVPEWWFEQYFGEIEEYISIDDPDEDGLTNLEEYLNGTDPTMADSDGDGMSDDWEIAKKIDPTDAKGINGPNGDPDGDGRTNMEEFQEDTKQPEDPGPIRDEEAGISEYERNILMVIVIIMIIIIVFLLFSNIRWRKIGKKYIELAPGIEQLEAEGSVEEVEEAEEVEEYEEYEVVGAEDEAEYEVEEYETIDEEGEEEYEEEFEEKVTLPAIFEKTRKELEGYRVLPKETEEVDEGGEMMAEEYLESEDIGEEVHVGEYVDEEYYLGDVESYGGEAYAQAGVEAEGEMGVVEEEGEVVEEELPEPEEKVYRKIKVTDEHLLKRSKDLQRKLRNGGVTYGMDETIAAAEAGAVETLLVIDHMALDKNEQIEKILKQTEAFGGKVIIVNSGHDAGKQLDALGGIGALLRFKMV
jgi:hypothetical protein